MLTFLKITLLNPVRPIDELPDTYSLFNIAFLLINDSLVGLFAALSLSFMLTSISAIAVLT